MHNDPLYNLFLVSDYYAYYGNMLKDILFSIPTTSARFIRKRNGAHSFSPQQIR